MDYKDLDKEKKRIRQKRNKREDREIQKDNNKKREKIIKIIEYRGQIRIFRERIERG